MQVNNLKIKYMPRPNYKGKWQVIAPNGSVLEEFGTVEAARRWAQHNHYFLKAKRGYHEPISSC